MALHIEELICNVTVVLTGTVGPLAVPPQPPAVEQGSPPAATGQPPLEMAIPRTITRPEAEEIMQDTVERQTRSLAAEGGLPADVDPKAVADRVYRLMREELALDLERE